MFSVSCIESFALTLLIVILFCVFSLCFRYVTYTSREEEHNLVVLQFYRHIYYRVSQPVTEGTVLRVWIGKDYATLLGLGMGEFCQTGLQPKSSHGTFLK